MLMLPDVNQPFDIYADAAAFAIGAVLCQRDEDGTLRPCAYASAKLNQAERNYSSYERELYAIVHAFRTWHHLLGNSAITVITDHKPLTGQPAADNFVGRRARWHDYLQTFDFVLKYQSGKLNVVADALSRRPDHIQLNHISLVAPQDLVQALTAEYAADPVCVDVISKVSEDRTFLYDEDTKLVYKLIKEDWKVYVPNSSSVKEKLVREHHDLGMSGHLGERKTLEALKRVYYWPLMYRTVQDYCKTCVSCQKNKSSQQRPVGLLHPLPTEHLQKWGEVTMDFIVGLPRTKAGFDSILTIVDRLTKMAYFAPCTATITAPKVAKLFFERVVCAGHGVPLKIISDRDSKFMSEFWQSMWAIYGTTLAPSTAYHPQSDGQSERTNRIIEQMLRHHVNERQDDWDQHLLPAQFAYNNAVQDSTQYSPFYLNYGVHPRTPGNLLAPPLSSNPSVQEFVGQMAMDISKAKRFLNEAQLRQKRYADLKRQEDHFQVGDLVLLSTKNLQKQTAGVAPKLQPKFVGPYEIIKALGNSAYKLQLPREFGKVHDVFHASLLKPYQDGSDQFPLRAASSRQAPVWFSRGEAMWEVEAIVGKKRNKYLVKYKGWDNPEWQPAEYVSHLPDLIAAFEQQQITRRSVRHSS